MTFSVSENLGNDIFSFYIQDEFKYIGFISILPDLFLMYRVNNLNELINRSKLRSVICSRNYAIYSHVKGELIRVTDNRLDKIKKILDEVYPCNKKGK